MNIFINKFKKISIVTISLLICIGPMSQAESRYSDHYSDSAIISDYKTNRIIYEKNADKKTAMASLSKLMTLLITFDSIKEHNVSKEDIVKIEAGDYNREGTNMKLVPGEDVKLGHMMDALMIISANDAALAISRHVGGDYGHFVNLMNQKAKEIGMKDTVFYNPNGLPMKMNINNKSLVVENHTTARDVLELCKFIYKNYPDELTEITNKTNFVDKAKSINEENTNPLLPLIPQVDGLKTGFTTAAGYCLTYSMPIRKDSNNDVNNRIIGVSMGAPSKEARKMASYEALNYINKHYYSKSYKKANQSVVKTKINGMGNFETNLVSKKDIIFVKKNGEDIKQEITYYRVKLSESPQSPLAKLVLKDGRGNIIASSDLYSEIQAQSLGIFAKLELLISSWFVDDDRKAENQYLLDFPVYEVF